MKRITLIGFALVLVFGWQGCKPVINKMAFHPDQTNLIPADRLPQGVQELFIETEDEINLQAYFIPNQDSDKIVLYFHGNAGNIGHRLTDLLRIHDFGVSVLGISFRGYGKSQGKPSEEGIYIDGRGALNFAIQKLGFSSGRVILFGRSIGTTVAVHVSQKKRIGGLILVTPLTSGKELAKASGLGFVSFLAANAFNNLDKIDKVRCPVLVIHGTQDKVIPFAMAKAIYDKARSEKTLVEIAGANHNNLSTTYQKTYWPPIRDFIRFNNPISSNRPGR